MRIALFAFFQRLYALYPCNFLRFLRFYFAGGTNKSSPERNNLFEFYVRVKKEQVFSKEKLETKLFATLFFFSRC